MAQYLRRDHEFVTHALSECTINTDVLKMKLLSAVDSANGAYLFNTATCFVEQLTASCSYHLADYLCRLFRFDLDVETTLLVISKLQPFYACICLKYSNEYVYIDATGIYPTLGDLLQRLSLSEDDVSVTQIPGAEVSERDCYSLNKILHYTPMWEFASSLLTKTHGLAQQEIVDNILAEMLFDAIPPAQTQNERVSA